MSVTSTRCRLCSSVSQPSIYPTQCQPYTTRVKRQGGSNLIALRHMGHCQKKESHRFVDILFLKNHQYCLSHKILQDGPLVLNLLLMMTSPDCLHYLRVVHSLWSPVCVKRYQKRNLSVNEDLRRKLKITHIYYLEINNFRIHIDVLDRGEGG